VSGQQQYVSGQNRKKVSLKHIFIRHLGRRDKRNVFFHPNT
jgi:hypothetical protein